MRGASLEGKLEGKKVTKKRLRLFWIERHLSGLSKTAGDVILSTLSTYSAP